MEVAVNHRSYSIPMNCAITLKHCQALQRVGTRQVAPERWASEIHLLDEGATWAALASCAALARRRRRVYHPIDRASPVAHGAARCQGLLARGQPRGGAANLAGKRRCVGAQRPEGEAL